MHLEVVCGNMALHNLLGKIGEERAATFLLRKGYTILERNWKIGDLETDIIAQEGETLVFVEVKTRTSGGSKRPEEAVDRERERRLVAGAQAYIRKNRLDNPWRFDIVAITTNFIHWEINHIEDAFLPSLRTINSHSFNGEKRRKRRKV